MKTAIMQPYFLPYIGYFQLIGAVDLFIVYDNIKYTKKGWINRNRMLQNHKDAMFSLPLKKDSDVLDIRRRELAHDFDREKLLRQISETYRRAPYFKETLPIVEKIIRHDDLNLFNFLYHSIICICEHLNLRTKICKSSDIEIDHTLKSEDKVLALCKAVKTNTYINAIGGIELYSKDLFRVHNIELQFIKSKPFKYAQFGGEFVPWLSILDVMMFNSRDAIRECIESNYELI